MASIVGDADTMGKLVGDDRNSCTASESKAASGIELSIGRSGGSRSLHAIEAAGALPSKAAVHRLVAVTLAGLRPTWALHGGGLHGVGPRACASAAILPPVG